jgi:ribosomal protein S18 acetylase RimI-like enzyme
MAPQNVQVRPATAQDVASIFNLILELAHYEKAPEQVVNSEQDLLQHGFITNPPLFYSWVAELPSVGVIGMALCYVRYSTWKGPVLYLEDIVVNENYRRLGIGQLLYDECLNFAKLHGYRRMTWQVLDWNEPAIEFYRKAGASFDNGWVNVSIDLNE